MKRVLVIPGDGIGPEVILPCVEIISEMADDIDIQIEAAGKSLFEKTGESISDKSMGMANKADAILFGATATVWDNDYHSPILALREQLDLYANVRPIRTIHPQNRKIDMVIIRENREGLYTRREERDSEGVTTFRRLTDAGCKRIVKFAHLWCERHARRRLVCVHKANVLRLSDGMFLNIFNDLAAENRAVESSDMLVDAAAMKMVMMPETFDTVVTLNLYGDILSDLAGGLIGGLGFVPSANIGDEHALFEPAHGAALDIAGKGIANPFAALMSSGMMLDYLGYVDEAGALNMAIERSLKRDIALIDSEGRCNTRLAFESVRKSMTMPPEDEFSPLARKAH